MVKLNQAKLMNEENWTKIETTDIRKNVNENRRMGKEIAGSEMEEKREEEWKTATREKEGNVKKFWGNHYNGVSGIWRGRGEWGKRKRNEKGKKEREKGRNSGKGRATDDKCKWSQNNEWVKLDWNNKYHEEEFEETDEEICKIGKRLLDRKCRRQL